MNSKKLSFLPKTKVGIGFVCALVALTGLMLVFIAVRWPRPSSYCKVHGVGLKSDWVPVIYGEPGYVPGYHQASKDFPNGDTKVEGGCVSTPDSPKTQLISFCKACRKAKAKWLKARAAVYLREI